MNPNEIKLDEITFWGCGDGPREERRSFPCPIGNLSAADFSQAVAESDTEWIGFIDGRSNGSKGGDQAPDIVGRDLLHGADARAEGLLAVYAIEPAFAEVLADLPPWCLPLLPGFDRWPTAVAIRKDRAEELRDNWPEGGLPQGLAEAAVRGVSGGDERPQLLLHPQDPICWPMRPGELPALGPEARATRPKWVVKVVRRLIDEGLSSVAQPHRAAIAAGLLLLQDELDGSHGHSQAVEGMGSPRTADYWHAIMHRREPDPGNSRYWFRRVGEHPVQQELVEWAPAVAEEGEIFITNGRWDPAAFIDAAGRTDSDEADVALRRIQLVEMLLLLRESFAATGFDGGPRGD